MPGERKTRDAALDRNFAFRMGDVALIGLDTGEDKPDCHPANGGFSRFTQYRQAQTEWLKDQFLVECKVDGDELLVRVHNVDKGEIAGEHRFKPRAPAKSKRTF